MSDNRTGKWKRKRFFQRARGAICNAFWPQARWYSKQMNSSSTVERRSVLNGLSVRRRRMRRNTSSSQSPRIQTGLTPGKNPPVPHEGGPIHLPEQDSEDRPELNRAVPALVRRQVSCRLDCPFPAKSTPALLHRRRAPSAPERRKCASGQPQELGAERSLINPYSDNFCGLSTNDHINSQSHWPEQQFHSFTGRSTFLEALIHRIVSG